VPLTFSTGVMPQSSLFTALGLLGCSRDRYEPLQIKSYNLVHFVCIILWIPSYVKLLNYLFHSTYIFVCVVTNLYPQTLHNFIM